MYLFLNENSYVIQSNANAAKESLHTLVLIFKQIRAIVDVKIQFVSHLDIWNQKIKDGSSLADFIGTMDHDSRKILLGAYSYLCNEKAISENLFVEYRDHSRACEGVTSAHERNAFSLTLNSDFCQSQALDLKNSSNTNVTFDKNVYSLSSFLNLAEEYVKIFFTPPPPTDGNHFPGKEICANLLGQKYQGYRDNCRQDNGLQIRLSDFVAWANGYSLNADLTSINHQRTGSQRRVYSSQGTKILHLSLDFTKSCFELLDHNGAHLGEFNFEGEKTSEADKTGNHNIFLK